MTLCEGSTRDGGSRICRSIRGGPCSCAWLICGRVSRSEEDILLNWPGDGRTIVARSMTMSDHALKPATGRARAERLEARVTTQHKALIEQAAALEGRTVTDFVLT